MHHHLATLAVAALLVAGCSAGQGDGVTGSTDLAASTPAPTTSTSAPPPRATTPAPVASGPATTSPPPAPTTPAASTTTSPSEQAPTEPSADGLTVLYAGHSFGRPFAENMDEVTRLAGIEGHEQRVVFRGGENGAPQAMWEDPDVQSLIKEQLDDGAVDVVILICCSKEFRETTGHSDQAVSDQAILEIVAYALEQNPETRFGLAMPWVDFPNDYATADEHRAITDAAYPQYQQLAENISEASNGVDVFAFYHGAAVYDIRAGFEQGMIPELTSLTGPRMSSVFTDDKGHAATMARDAGTLTWLHAIYGIDPLELPPITAYAVDIREIAATALHPRPSQHSDSSP